MDIAPILASFKTATKEFICNNTQPGSPSWVEVFAVFNGNVTERMTLLADGSDAIAGVLERQRTLRRKYPGYLFQFDGFQQP